VINLLVKFTSCLRKNLSYKHNLTHYHRTPVCNWWRLQQVGYN